MRQAVPAPHDDVVAADHDQAGQREIGRRLNDQRPEVDPLLWNPETFGLTPYLLISNRADIAE
jgi:hypothetical protein